MRSGSPSSRDDVGVATCGLLMLALSLAFPGSLPAPSDTKVRYDARCGSCHGVGGAGDGAAAKALKVPLPSFTDSAFAAGRTDDQLTASIANGKAPMMPAFGKQLKPEQIKALVAYIRQFRKPSAK